MDKEKLASLLWDSPVEIDADRLVEVLTGREILNEVDYPLLVARMLVSFRWYDLVDMFGLEQMLAFLDEKNIERIWKESMKEEFRYIRNVLQRVLQPAV